jgi:hypothetical protein
VVYLNASECEVTVSSDLTDLADFSITVSEKIINTFQDLTSNKLSTAGVGDLLALLPIIQVFNANNVIHLRCDQPDMLPPQVEILNISGLRLGTYRVENAPENLLPHNLNSGIYFIVLNTKSSRQVHRVVVVSNH